jgi:hypothetical protein
VYKESLKKVIFIPLREGMWEMKEIILTPLNENGENVKEFKKLPFISN